MEAKTANQDSIQTFHYGTKKWFTVVCGLNDKGLVPGQTLTEKHISKQDCILHFGDQKANNGYKVGKLSEFCDRVVWLWKRVHQADRPPNNDIGLRFCQGLLYEDRNGEDTVDWAQFAANTVNWFHGSKGMTQVHKDWANAAPSITIDVNTGKKVCALHPSKPIQGNQRTFKIPTTSSTGDAKKRRVEPNQFDSRKVKKEYVPVYFSTPTESIPSPKASAGIDKMPFGCTSAPKSPKSPRASVGIEDMPSGSTPTLEIPIPNVPAPKAFAGSKEMPMGCSPALLNVLQLFRVDIERAVNLSITNLEEQKSRLKTILDHNRHEVEVATATIKSLMEDLENAKKNLISC